MSGRRMSGWRVPGIWRSRGRHSGAPCFDGTRVPVGTMIAYLAAGETLNEFLGQYPGVTRDAAQLVLVGVSDLLDAVVPFDEDDAEDCA